MEFSQESNDKKFPLSRKLLGGFFGIGIGLLLFISVGLYFLKGVGHTTADVSLLLSAIIGGLVGWKCYSSTVISRLAPFIKIGFLSIVSLLVAIFISFDRGNFVYFSVGVVIGVISFVALKHRIYEKWVYGNYLKSYSDKTIQERSELSNQQSKMGIPLASGLVALSLIEFVYGKTFLQYLILPIGALVSAAGTLLLLALLLTIKAKSSQHSNTPSRQ